MNTGVVLLISDLHLAPACPRISERFVRFLRGPARAASALYILGDLFEVWIGDDDLDNDFNESMLGELADLASTGVKIAFVRGNRDFLCGPASAQRAGWTLLEDETRLEMDDLPDASDRSGQTALEASAGPRTSAPVLLLHGDTLCTDDRAYQRFRAITHHWLTRTVFLALPLRWRQRIARRLRERSASHQARAPHALGDVSRVTVIARFRASGVSTMIHGHTHRPARHDLVVDARACERWVLPDWTETRGGYLAIEPGQRPRQIWLD